MIFREFHDSVFVQDAEGRQFSCPAKEFSSYESSYEGIQRPYTSRYWSQSVQYLSTGNAQHKDPLYTPMRLAEYCSKIVQYQAAYEAAHPPDVPVFTTVYVDVSIAGGDGEPVPAMYPEDSTDTTLHTLTFSGVLLRNPDDTASIIPVSKTWRVPVFQVAREKFGWEAVYAPLIVGSFQQQIDIKAGVFTLEGWTRDKEGVYMISDDSFELINGTLFGVPGTFYKVSIIDGPKFFKVVLDEKIKKNS